MIDPTPLGMIASAIEQAIKTSLKFDPGTRASVYALADNVIVISITDTQLCCVLRIHSDDISVAVMPEDHSGTLNSDLLIQGSAANLSSLASNKTYSLSGSGVEVIGRVSLLEQLHHISQHLDIDWQDALNQVLPSALVGPLGMAIQKSSKGLRSALTNISQQMNEYSQHESGYVVTKNEFRVFSEDVAALRQRSDRLIAKFEQLIKENKHS